jgi:hypothetical protein
MGRWRFLVAGVLITVGVMLSWPWIRANTMLETADGQILDVLVEDAGAGNGRVLAIYRWEVQQPGERLSLGGTRFGTQRLKQGDDPVLPRAAAESLADTLRSQNRGRVYYEPRDPAGTAFLMSYAMGGADRRYDVGLVLVVVGMLALLMRGGRP